MRQIFVILLMLGAWAMARDAAADPLPQWQSIDDPKNALQIHGSKYAPETALHDWNIQRATNLSADVFRFEVRGGDEWADDRESGENKERSELDGYATRWGDKTPVWGAYSFFVEPGSAYHSDWTAIGQMHGSKVRPFHIHFTNDVLTIYSEQPGSSGAAISARYSGKIGRNAWHNVVFHLVQNASNAGRFEFWLDGKKIVDFTGSIGAEGNQAYWKFGIYRGYGPIATPFAIQYANMEVGTHDLTARIANPLPIK